MKCLLTGVEGKPIAAHVIPRAFYEIDPHADGPHRIISNADGVFPRRAPIGVYDKTIVTEEGERQFSPWDNYAAKLLIEERDQLKPICVGSRIVGYSRDHYNYTLLKLFALSVIWRAGVSSQSFFDRVRLGPHEARIREHLMSTDPGEPSCYSVVFSMWEDREQGPGMMDPFRERYKHVNFYRIYLGNYICYVKVDQRPTPGSLQYVQLAPKYPLVVIARNLASSKEFPIMKRMSDPDAR